ncbi:MAG: hypothetical protein KIT83_15815 [Bryobacterales bacterium]|nr:hypothetical protein [Bryobacterales bacterium]
MLLLVGLACTLPSLAAAEAPLAPLPAMFPLEVGNQWSYETADGQHRFTISVGIPEMHDGTVYFAVKGYGYGPNASKLLVRAGVEGNLFTRDESIGADALLTSFTYVPGGAFDSRLGPCEEMGRVAAERRPWEFGSQSKAAAVAITYQNFACADLGLVEEMYVENIGLVSRTMTTIAGPRQYRLVYARVGNLVYRPKASSTLSIELDQSTITLDPEGNHAPVPVTLRYAVEPLTGGTLRFNSAQLYDFYLVDSSGSEVWRWSSEFGFIQPITEVSFAGMIEFTEQLPVQRFAPGSYMLYGKLNTNSSVQPTVGTPIQITEAQTIHIETLRRIRDRRMAPMAGQ